MLVASQVKLKPLVIGGLAAALCLGGCNKPAADGGLLASPFHHSRYFGVGLYPPGRMWTQMVVASAPKDSAASRPNDDEQVIVVVDSDTGELRQCGNMSGYCVRMNPWATPLAAPQIAPIPLVKHADQLDREASDAAAEAAAARAKPHKTAARTTAGDRRGVTS